jgi:hypothetical protein
MWQEGQLYQFLIARIATARLALENVAGGAVVSEVAELFTLISGPVEAPTYSDY